ncbi:MAG: hypothetical protein HW400_593 [Candidatus Levybacteria bacterium]|nr:hypothetical protein [Candidatus Levybacteria bacterium]
MTKFGKIRNARDKRTKGKLNHGDKYKWYQIGSIKSNSKHEYRNSKQYQMTKVKNSKRFENSDLENLICFGFRILVFGF